MVKVYRQGDVVLIPVKAPVLRGDEVLSHNETIGPLELRGETGGVHMLPVMTRVPTVRGRQLVVLDRPEVMTHTPAKEDERPHPPLEIPAGSYEVRQAREFGTNLFVD